MSDEKQTRNATITKVDISLDRGFAYSIWITLDYGDSGGQQFGGYMLSHVKKEPCVLLSMWIVEIMKTFEVEHWDDLVGKPCRVVSEWNKVHKIGHFTKDKWFDPVEINKNFKIEECDA